MVDTPNLTVFPFNKNSIVKITTPEEPVISKVSTADSQTNPYIKVSVYDNNNSIYALNLVAPTFKVIEDSDSGLTYILILGEAAFQDIGTVAGTVAAGNHSHSEFSTVVSFTDLVDTPNYYDEYKYLRATTDGLEWVTISEGASTTNLHSDLFGLSYDESGHTGFVSEFDLVSVSGSLQFSINKKADISHLHDDRYYTEGEITTLLSGYAPSHKTVLNKGNVSGNVYFDLTMYGVITLTLAGASNFYLTGTYEANKLYVCELLITNGNAYTITWNSKFDFVGGSTPVLTTAGKDSITLVVSDGGNTCRVFINGLDIK